MDNPLKLIKHVLDKLPSERLLRAAALLAPLVGASIAELIPTRDTDRIVDAIRQLTDAQTERLLLQVQHLADEANGLARSPIAVVGSGNLEMLLHSPSSERITMGSKHSVKVESLWGGSGVNFTARLLAAGRSVLPVLPIADDHGGEQIIQALRSVATEGGVIDDISKQWSELKLFNCEARTPTTVLIIHGSERTAFRQQIETGDRYLSEMTSQIDQLCATCATPSALLIGHVPRGREAVESTAEVVEHLIDKYRNRALIYSVFGSSQLHLGWEFWEKHIRDNIDIFQLNLSEAKSFFSDDGKASTTEAVLDRLRHLNTSAVLTMDRFGAIAINPQSDDIYMAWPLINSAEVVDSTGAGDAFAAGMISVLCDIGPGYTTHHFEQALAEGSRWAAAACTIQGGAGRSPGKELAAFIDSNERCRRNNIETRRHCSMQELLTFVDLAYE